ncbi:MAG: hypothetical protein CSYNP_02576 [Syntrophus sp. SKADARSKE-3]|nr:hypothetical protein [Syntrophus sp. SKADARSKE-3]
MSTTDRHLHRLIYRAMMGKGRHLPPASAFRMTRLWAGLTSFHKAPSIRLLEREYLSCFIEGLTPENGVWTSIFVPTELLYAFGLAPLCLEGLSALTAGMGIAHDFLGRHGTHFIPATMCNFHRLGIDLAKSGLLPRPRFILASSALCDGNLNTFRHIAEETDTPFFFLDIPHNDNEAGRAYLTSQLEALIAFIERIIGRPLNSIRLEEAANHLKVSSKLMDTIYKKRCRLTRNIFHGHEMIDFMLAMNIMAGSSRLVSICRAIDRDIDDGSVYNHTLPKELPKDAVRIVWSHIAPTFQYSDIWPAIDDGISSKIVMEECTRVPVIDTSNSLAQIVSRLINIPGNEPMKRRLQLLETICDDSGADGIVHFSNWGCQQATGAAPIMQHYFAEMGIPFLNINGNCADRTSCGSEQHKTRYSAFLKAIAAKKSGRRLISD